jgi:hypothetical protein
LLVVGLETGAPTVDSHLCPGCPWAGFEATLPEFKSGVITEGLFVSTEFTNGVAFVAGKFIRLLAD